MFTTLRRTLRSLKRSPIYFATATLSLAIGLGLCTASFLFIDSIQRPHLPYADVDRLYFPQLRLGNQRNPPSLAEIQRSLTLLPGIERIASLETGRENVAFDGEGANRLVAHFSDDFFEVIGIRPRLGRFPNAEEARSRSAVVVTAVTWHEKFGDAKEIGNARMEVGDRSYAIVGVLPRGTDLSFQGDVWVPLASESELETTKQNGGVGGFADFGLATLVVKLRPHVGSGTINSQLATIAASLTSRFVAPGSHTPAYVFQLKSVRPRPATLDDFGILMILIGVGVLVIAATNVAALSLARGLTRKRDYALRIALGASRAAIAGEVLAEIGVIAAVGSAGGVFMARAMIGALTHIVPAELAARWYVVPEFSGRLFGFAAAALIGAIALAGALPAWRASRVNPSDPLKDSAGTTTGRSRHEFRLLIVGELAVSMVLLMLASLMSLSVRNLTSYQFGYDARRLLSAHVYLPFTKDTADRPARREAQLASLARIRAADGVLSAATMSGVYLPDWEMSSEGMMPGDPPLHTEPVMLVSPQFFATLGVPVTHGRDFLDGDREQGGAVILSTRASKILFPHGGAVGRMVKWGGEHATKWMPVVGVVGDFEVSLHDPRGRDTYPPVYVSMNHSNIDGWGIVIRPRSDDPKLALALQAKLRDALPPRATAQVVSWVADYENYVRYRTFFAQLFGFIATAAMILGAAGLFSVLSYVVSQRMREFAVRTALGATRRDLLKVVFTYALEMSLAGTAIGALLSFWASAGVSAYLYGVKNTDPVSLVVAELVLLTITMLTAFIPAVRATRADPVEVLRAT